MKCNFNRMGVSIIFVLLLSTVFLNCAQKQSIFGVYETENGTIIRIAQGNDTECVVSIGKLAYIGKIVGNGVKLYYNQIETNGAISFVSGVIMANSTCDTIFYYGTDYATVYNLVNTPMKTFLIWSLQLID